MPLTPLEIKLCMVRKGQTFTGMARKFSKKLRRPVWPETVSRTAYGKPGYEQSSLRELIAKELEVAVDDLPRYISKKAKATELKTAQVEEAAA